MGSMFMRFPGGKAKALTLSYDDGVEQDIRLIEIMKKHGLKGTFNINSGLYAAEGTVYPEGHIHRRMTKKMVEAVYQDSGIEVAVHGLTHPFLDQLPEVLCTKEILQDRENLEEQFGGLVRGMAYPFGTYSDAVVDTLRRCGIVYSRTVISTRRFDIPTDWLRLPATCHHKDPQLMELARRLAEGEFNRAPALFYLWGHSYEFEKDDNWNVIEEFAEYIGNRDDIWYATNIEVYDYVEAYRQLRCSASGDRFYNPTNTEIYFMYNNKAYSVKPGEYLECAR